MKVPTRERFLKDVARHVMHVEHDDGLHRHIKFREHGSGQMWFDIVTWPGYLCISGDMGCYVFARIPDMIEFFRTNDLELDINLYYWTQKIQAADRCGIERFDRDKFVAAVNHDLESHFDSEPVPQDLRKAVEDEVLYYAGDGEYAAVQAAMDFEHGKFRFHDFYEHDLKEHTYQYVWCLYAIAWAVKQYDAAKTPAAISSEQPA